MVYWINCLLMILEYESWTDCCLWIPLAPIQPSAGTPDADGLMIVSWTHQERILSDDYDPMNQDITITITWRHEGRSTFQLHLACICLFFTSILVHPIITMSWFWRQMKRCRIIFKWMIAVRTFTFPERTFTEKLSSKRKQSIWNLKWSFWRKTTIALQHFPIDFLPIILYIHYVVVVLLSSFCQLVTDSNHLASHHADPSRVESHSFLLG